ncbi:MAG: hypothetical protein ACE5GJ_10150 [Gemmatimonadota bacterium]
MKQVSLQEVLRRGGCVTWKPAAMAAMAAAVGVSLLLGSPEALEAQALSRPEAGPVIQGFGPSFAVQDPDFPTPKDEVLRVVLDVSQGGDDPARVNRRIETVARFLNMHARADPAGAGGSPGSVCCRR